MKKILALVIALTLLCTVLVSCDNAVAMVKKANEALEQAPYNVTLKMDFESDNKQINDILSTMNTEIPVSVDGKNIAMDMSLGVMGYTVDADIVIADMVMYCDVSLLGQNIKMKTDISEEQYDELMSENNVEMPINPTDFGELKVETKDGKKYIACGKISDEGLEELNGIMEKALESVDGEASVVDISYGVTLNDGKYEKMDLMCVYSVTVSGNTCTVTFNLDAQFSYDNVQSIAAPAGASSYTKVDINDFLG